MRPELVSAAALLKTEGSRAPIDGPKPRGSPAAITADLCLARRAATRHCVPGATGARDECWAFCDRRCGPVQLRLRSTIEMRFNVSITSKMIDVNNFATRVTRWRAAARRGSCSRGLACAHLARMARLEIAVPRCGPPRTSGGPPHTHRREFRWPALSRRGNSGSDRRGQP